jgi:putative N6-adenine-specific DNA methylase
MSAASYACFIVCAPGLEALVVRELGELGLDAEAVVGGVSCRLGLEDLGRVLLRSRLAEALRVRLKPFSARSFSALEKELLRMPWHAFVGPATPVVVHSNTRRSKLFHSDAVSQRVARAIEERRRGRVDPTLPPQRIDVRILRDEVTVSVDAGGERLHKRGYRTDVEAAPLRETLAAAAARCLEDQQPSSIERVWDPFCGSGVLGLEWLLLRTGVAAGLDRSFAFEGWPIFDPASFERLRQEAAAEASSQTTQLHAFGSDVNAKSLASAERNAQRAQLASATTWLRGDFGSIAERIPQGTAVLANPPYGRRLGSPRLARRLYHRFDQLLLERTDLRPVVVVSGYPDFLKRSRLPWTKLVRTRSGGLNVNLVGLGV